MRANLHAVRPALRIRRVSILCEAVGAIHATPGHENTTKSCPKCLTAIPKGLNERTHACGCGLTLPRDQASAIMTLGKALLEYREGPDPGGRVAKRRDDLAKAAEKLVKRKKRLADGRAKKKKQQQETTTEVQNKRQREVATTSTELQDVVRPGPGSASGGAEHQVFQPETPPRRVNKDSQTSAIEDKQSD